MQTKVDYLKYLSSSVFDINTRTSFLYLSIDLGCYFTLMLTLCNLHLLITNAIYYYITFNILSFVCGFYMWCLFVIAHDCGHGTFSRNNIVNNIVGEFVNSFLLLTPWYSWKSSHHLHHLHHNHFKNDFSHVWFISSKKNSVMRYPINRYLYLIRLIQPFLAWPIYLYFGQPDGGHLLLFGRLWKDKSMKEITRAYVSSIIVICSAYLHMKYIGLIYLLPWIWYGWWLFSVTYLQHHHEGQIVYDKEWNYFDGAMQTIDRTYGYPIDNLSHHITDCHVVHHLAFTRIPHYHLRQATDELLNGLKRDNVEDMYKHEYTGLFHIFPYFWKHWFFIDQVR